MIRIIVKTMKVVFIKNSQQTFKNMMEAIDKKFPLNTQSQRSSNLNGNENTNQTVDKSMFNTICISFYIHLANKHIIMHQILYLLFFP